jgi:putative nucleotidyltransferase with HDIG domain
MVEIIEDRDTYTAGHSARVARYSKLIAQEMGYSEKDCIRLYQAAMLHDVGKVATPDAVLLNPKQLNDIEYKLVQEHVMVGYKLLSNVPMFSSLADIVYSHHERYDGTGYPRGLKGNEIMPLARIIIVADAFDAMTTSRIYKARQTIPEALSELKSLSKIQFHPEVVEAAIEVLKDINIDDEINQLPKSEVEEMRFAYFYKDILTHVYNEDYLEVVLAKNEYEKQYNYLYAVFIKNFSRYNKEHSWTDGNEVLKKIADTLNGLYTDAIVFRTFGDDFVLLSKEEVPSETFTMALDNLLDDIEVNYNLKVVELSKQQIKTPKDIESIEYEK